MNSQTPQVQQRNNLDRRKGGGLCMTKCVDSKHPLSINNEDQVKSNGIGLRIESVQGEQLHYQNRVPDDFVRIVAVER